MYYQKTSIMLYILLFVFGILGMTGCDSEGMILEEASAQMTETSEIASADETVAGEIVIYICGEVVRPGIYTGDTTMRLWDYIALAGGFLETADESALDLARFACDQETIFVPAKGSADSESGGTVSDGLVNINTADISALCTLPGIGEARAQAILAYREEHGLFAEKEDLMKVPGIKEATFSRLEDLIKVR